jgi:ferredoxin-type protein NapG
MSGRGDVSRRDFLTGIFRGRNLALVGTGGVVWAHVVEGSRGSELSRRPPGALEERDFVATCIRCGQCIEACPFDTLRLATAGSDTAIGTPFFEPREVPCHMCSDTPCIEACPSGALEAGTAIEDARMGLAVLVDQENCLAFQGLRCEVCYRACPLMGKAIALEFEPQERTGKHAFFLPVVQSDACTGCGICEHTCILEEAAIKVLPRDLARGRLGAGYRFGWREAPEISRDFGPSDSTPEPGAWRDNTDRVLSELEDLRGIEEP